MLFGNLATSITIPSFTQFSEKFKQVCESPQNFIHDACRFLFLRLPNTDTHHLSPPHLSPLSSPLSSLSSLSPLIPLTLYSLRTRGRQRRGSKTLFTVPLSVLVLVVTMPQICRPTVRQIRNEASTNASLGVPHLAHLRQLQRWCVSR